ncbi:MAG: deoxyribodipyrimidine photo-lyase [Bacteroidales bacterium]|jgi:deoxyribodipyrimidine photo-lyase
MQTISVFWFRRDLRLEDNRGLREALRGPFPVLPLFIFDENIIAELEADDPRITFIHNTLARLSDSIKRSSVPAATTLPADPADPAASAIPAATATAAASAKNPSGGLYCTKGNPLEVWKMLLERFSIGAVYANEDYEPYAISRDREIRDLLASRGIPFHLFKDQVIFAKDDVLKKDGTPYTVFTPYKNKWISKLQECPVRIQPDPLPDRFAGLSFSFPSLAELGFKRSLVKVPDYDIDNLDNYREVRDYPALDQTSHLSVHLRFGTVSIRRIVNQAFHNEAFLSELIWREFFMQILYHFPNVVGANFRKKYDTLAWINDPQDFEKWKQGTTGFPLVDAGMRELNATGYMHNRVRMIVAGFLCKDLLIDWRWGEAYFATKLLDYELSSNNGNWQWAAGTGCDAVPYFRIFNPAEQLRKYDPRGHYVRKWIPELDTPDYPSQMVDHKMARERFVRRTLDSFR